MLEIFRKLKDNAETNVVQVNLTNNRWRYLRGEIEDGKVNKEKKSKTQMKY